MPPDSTETHDDFERIGVVGAGTMGYGIGLYFALSGASVALFDADPERLVDAEDGIDSALETFVDAGRVSPAEKSATKDRIRTANSLSDCVGDADLVTEAVTEDLDVKRAVFGDLSEHAPGDAVLATNTSGLSITEIASVVDDPGRVVGTHWFNPPHIVPLVEVVKGEQTRAEVAERVHAYLESIDKTPVMVEKDVPGFIGNRIQMAMCYEAFSLLDDGVASAAAIDRAVKAGFGFRLPVLGIFEKVDQSGVDVHHDVEDYLMPDLDRGTDPNPVVSELVADGDYGIQTGKGVYDWEDVDTEKVYERRDRRLLELLGVYTDEPTRPTDP